MQLVDQKNDVQIVGGGETNQCTIEMDGHMFSVLSGLYSNRIVAVVREISTNAYDAHVEAGIPEKPFDVHLPTVLEPWFSVRDYGPGMDSERLSKVYKAYGKSTKRDSNDGVGCLGLGSKSPFCYTSAFTVTSYYNGQMTQLAGHLNDNGIPAFTVMQECPTTEPNGVEVQVATKNTDVDSFKLAAVNLYRYFDVKPKLAKSGSFVDLSPPAVKLMFDRSFDLNGRKISYKVASHSGNFSRVVMGPVSYPIDPSALNLVYTGSAYKLISHGVEIKVPIGTLNIAPSREALKYSPGTILTLKDILQAVVTDITGQSDDVMKNVDNLWKARCTVTAIRDNLSRIIDTSNFKLDYKGKPVPSDIKNKDYPELKFELFRKGYRKSDYGVHRSHRTLIEARDNVAIIRADLKTGNIGRVAYFTSLQDNFDVYLLHGENDEVDKFIKEEELESVIKKTSELADIPPAAKTVRKARSKNPLDHVGLMKFNGKVWEAAATPPDKGVYAITSRYNVNMLDANGNVLSIDQGHYGLPQVVANIVEYDKDFVLYGVRPKHSEKMQKQTGWVLFEDYLRKTVKEGAERTKKYGVTVNVLKSVAASGAPNIFRYGTTNFKDAKSKVSRNGVAYKAFDAFDKAFSYDSKIRREGELLAKLAASHYSIRHIVGATTEGNVWDDKVPADLLENLNNQVTAFLKAYPLVGEKVYYGNNPCNPDKLTENFLDYLRGMDALRSKKLAHVRKMKVT